MLEGMPVQRRASHKTTHFFIPRGNLESITWPTGIVLSDRRKLENLEDTHKDMENNSTEELHIDSNLNSGALMLPTENINTEAFFLQTLI